MFSLYFGRSNRSPVHRVLAAPAALIDDVYAACPALREVAGGLGLILQVLLSEVSEPPGRTVPAPYRLICEIAGFEPHQIEQGNARANEVLDSVMQALATTNSFRLVEIEHSHGDRLARRLRLDRLPESVAAGSESARMTLNLDLALWREVPVLGRPRRLNRTASARREAELKDSLPTYGNTVDLTQSLLQYLNEATKQKTFSRLKREAGSPATQEFVRGRYPDAESFQRVAAVLRDVQFLAKPVYAPSAKTPRVHALGRNATGLPSPVRRQITGALGWVELDLAHAQVACNARRWNVEAAMELLSDRRYSFWDDLLRHMGADPASLREAQTYGDFKGLLKPVVHGLSFGMGARRIMRFGLQDGEEPDTESARLIESVTNSTFEEAGRRLCSHRLLSAMLEARREMYRRIREEGGWTDPFGRHHPYEVEPRRPGEHWDRGNEGSLLAIDTQATELLLLEPVIRAAIDGLNEAKKRNEQPSFRIVLWQHDGFTIKPRQRSRAETEVRKLQRLVCERATELGIPTALTVDVGPDIEPPWPEVQPVSNAADT